MARITFRDKYYAASGNDRDNPLIHLANRLIYSLEERHAAGKTQRKKIGLAGGNPGQICVDAVTIRWNRWKMSANHKIADRRQRLTVIDNHGRVPRREFLLPHSLETQDAVVHFTKTIWASRDTEDAWFYQI
jgi:hypothetical protein